MQIDRLFQIVYLLLSRKSMTAKELAAYFGVSARTILRDVDALSAAKVPIYTIQGKGGGIALLDGFVLNKAALREEEQNQILLALQSLAVTGEGETKETLSKLSALFHKLDADWIEVDFSRWGQGTGDRRRFDLLKSSILGRRAILFDYVASDGAKSGREVYPLKLVFKSKAWYLQGFCLIRKDYRTFKISRMRALKSSQTQFPAGVYTPPPIEASDPPSPALVSLELEFTSRAAPRAYDEFDEGCIMEAEDGTCRVSVRLPEDNWLYGFLLSLGKDVTVLSPAHVARRLEEKRKR